MSTIAPAGKSGKPTISILGGTAPDILKYSFSKKSIVFLAVSRANWTRPLSTASFLAYILTLIAYFSFNEQ